MNKRKRLLGAVVAIAIVSFPVAAETIMRSGYTKINALNALYATGRNFESVSCWYMPPPLSGNWYCMGETLD